MNADEKRHAAELEAELAALTQTVAARKTAQEQVFDLDGDFFISDGAFCGKDIIDKLGFASDRVFFATANRMLWACVVPSHGYPGHKRNTVGKIFDVCVFLREHCEHPLIQRLAKLPPKMAQIEEIKLWKELRDTFPHEEIPRQTRHAESGIT